MKPVSPVQLSSGFASLSAMWNLKLGNSFSIARNSSS